MTRPRVGYASAEAGPERSPLAADAFRRLVPLLCMVGAVTHVAFLVFFVVSGVHVLAIVNVASVACYLVLLQLIRRRRTTDLVEFVVLAGEILVHAVVATLVLGWNSGFHFYLLLTVPVLAVSSLRPVWLKISAVAAGGVGYIALDLWLRGATPTRELTDVLLEVLYYLNLLAALIILAGLAGRYRLLITQSQHALQLIATTDPLTGLRNRQSLTEFIDQHHNRAQRGHDLSFVMCDVDHFKQINDRGGHAAGDAALRAISRSLSSSVRVTDVVGRWGGEEFLAVLPDADADEAARIAERLRADVATLSVDVGGEPRWITMTVGVSTLVQGEAAAWAVARADAALYRGKRAGRNRVVVATSPPGGDRVAL